jgi:hypothetical protein
MGKGVTPHAQSPPLNPEEATTNDAPSGLAGAAVDADGQRGGVASCQGSVADKLKFFAAGKHREGSGLGEFRAYSARRQGRGLSNTPGRPVGKPTRLSKRGGNTSGGSGGGDHARV